MTRAKFASALAREPKHIRKAGRAIVKNLAIIGEAMTIREARQCKECSELKSLDGFRVAMKRGRPYRLIVCRECEIVYYRSPHRRAMARTAENQRRDHGSLRQKEHVKSALYRKRHPERARAKEIMNEAVAAGRINRLTSCEECGLSPAPKRNGASRIQAHHSDYSAPLSVFWLCEPCHMKRHRRAPSQHAENR